MKKTSKYIAAIALIATTQNANAINAPTEIPGLVWWVDGKNVNGNGTNPADGSTVTNWQDLSGSNLNLTTGVGNAVEYDDNAFNDCGGAVRFGANGNSQLQAGDPFGGTQGASTVFVSQREATRRANVLLSFNGNTTTTRSYLLSVWTNNQIYNRIANNFLIGASGITTGDPFYLTAFNNPTAAPNRFLRVNGGQIATNNTAVSTPTNLGIRLGSGWVPTTYWYNGWIGEVIVYNRALSTAEIQEVEEYLDKRWVTCNTNSDIVISKTVNNPTPDENGTITYTINVENNGPANVSNFQLTDTLPPGITYQSNTATTGTVTP